MKIKRIIPCLDVKGERVVKGVHFVNLKDAADPVELARIYDEEGADEIVFLDIVATLEKRKTRLDLAKRIAEVVSAPLIVGGGIAELEDMERLIKAGVNKVSINTAAVRDPHFLKEASQKFGRNSIILAIDAKRTDRVKSGFEVYIEGGRRATGIDAIQWAKKGEDLGAAEILPTSIDMDGTKEGYDIELTRSLAEAVNIPLIASGGAGNLEHLYQALTEGKADAVLAASLFHFRLYTIKEAKEYLKNRGVAVRL